MSCSPTSSSSLLFRCELCSAVFSRRSNLFRHENALHIGRVERHQCARCERSYATRANLRRHERDTHVPELRYTCDELGCARTFTSSSSLAQHRARHHAEAGVSYECSACGKRYARADKCRRHIAIKHKTADEPSAASCKTVRAASLS